MKNNCPFLTVSKHCSHKNMNFGKNKKLYKCPHKNENKCRLYNSWVEQRKDTTGFLKWLKANNLMEDEE